MGGERDHLLGDPARRVRPRWPLRRAATSAAEASGPISTPMPAVPVDRLGDQLADPVQHRPGPRPRRWSGTSAPTPGSGARPGSRRSAPARSSTWPCRRPPRCPARWPGRTRPAAATSKTSAPIAPARRVDQIDQLDVQPQVERVDPLAGAAVPHLTALHRQVVGRGPAASPPARPAAGARTRRRRPDRWTAAPPCRRAARWASRQSPHHRQGAGRSQQARRPGQVGQHGVHQVADRDRVRRTAGVADVVLQHPPAAELVADQVEAHDRRPDSAAGSRRASGRQPGEPSTSSPAQHAVGDDPLLAVHVAQEQSRSPGRAGSGRAAVPATRAG